MTEAFGAEDGAAPPVRPRRTVSRRPRALLPTLAIVVVLVVLASFFVEIWTDRLWYQSLGFGSVFGKILWTRVVLFVIFGLVFAAAIVGNVILAYRMRPILLSDGYRNPTIERYQDAVDPFRRWIVVGLGVTFFLFAGASAAGRWKTYLLWRNGVPFGKGRLLPQGHRLLRLRPALVPLPRRLRDAPCAWSRCSRGRRALPVRRHPAAEHGRPASRAPRRPSCRCCSALFVLAEGGRLLARPLRPGLPVTARCSPASPTPTATPCCRPRRS